MPEFSADVLALTDRSAIKAVAVKIGDPITGRETGPPAVLANPARAWFCVRTLRSHRKDQADCYVDHPPHSHQNRYRRANVLKPNARI
jgi:hypothetical protein